MISIHNMYTKYTNGDQRMTRNNAFSTIPKKLSFTRDNFSLSFHFITFFCREIKNKIIPC